MSFFLPGGIAGNQNTRRKYGSRGHNAARRDNGFFPDLRIIQDDRIHPDNGFTANTAVVQYSAVSDGNILPDEGTAIGHMDDAVILHTGSRPYHDRPAIPRSTAPNQMLAPSSIVTSPIIVALGAINAVPAIFGCFPLNARIKVEHLPLKKWRYRPYGSRYRNTS